MQQVDDLRMDSNVSPSGPAAISGLMGLLLAFIGGLVTLVIVLEYDPEARYHLDHGLPVEGTVVDVRLNQNADPLAWEPQLSATFFIEYLLDGKSHTAISRPVYGARMDSIRKGSSVFGYVLSDNPDYIILRDAMPHAPRDAFAFLGPAIFWILGAICLIFGPEMLYAGTTASPQNGAEIVAGDSE